MKLSLFILWVLFFDSFLFAQEFQYLGLANKNITALKIGNGLVVVGTNYNSVYWQTLSNISDSSWNKIEFDSFYVTAVYPHKSGPLGWAIGIASRPDWNSRDFIFCSYLGSKPTSISSGIDTNNTLVITGIDGFPDPTICGETFAIGGRKLYRRFFQDTVWHSVYDLTFEGNFASLKAREDNQYVYAGGAEGFAGILLIRSSDKGDTWENLSPCNVQDLDFYGDTIHNIIVTDRFKILMSTDSGTNWLQIFQTDSLVIQNISFSTDGKSIYAVTNTLFYGIPRSYFFYSSDLGETWNVLQLPIYDIIANMDLDTDDNIYLASISSGVIKLKSPVVDVKEKLENIFTEYFILYQNYPNPFNPSTKISWQSPVSSWQTLKVYDVLGNEVATLVDEYKPAGRYEVEFSAKGGLASGVYCYKLRVGEFVQTNKMIFMR